MQWLHHKVRGTFSCSQSSECSPWTPEHLTGPLYNPQYILPGQTYACVENNSDMFVSQASAMSVWNAGQMSHRLLWQRCLFFHTWMEKYSWVCTREDTRMCACAHTHSLIHALLWLPWQQGTKLCWKAQGHAGVYMLTHTHTLHFPSQFFNYQRNWWYHKYLSTLGFWQTHTQTHNFSLPFTEFLTITHIHTHTCWIAGAI